MAKIPSSSRMRLTYPTGDAFITLRRPTNEEQNAFEAARFHMPDNVSQAEMMQHAKKAICDFFDLLATKIEDLEDDKGPITLDRLDAIPQDQKVEVMHRRWVPSAVEEKN